VVDVVKKLLAVGIILLLVGVSIPSTTTIGVINQEPELIIEGPTEGKVGVPYDYTFYLTEQEGCEIYYKIDWGDGNKTEWLGPYESSVKLELTHTWYERGWYDIFVEAKGCNGSKYSDWYWVLITTTLYVGGSGPNNYTSIRDAIGDAHWGDTVFVYDDSSPYYENIVIYGKSINLIGENKETTIIHGCNKGSVVEIWDYPDRVRISNFTLQNGTAGYLPHGIWIGSGEDNCIITDNIIKDNIGAIFCSSSSSNIIISNNIIINHDTSLIVKGNNNIISNNTIKNNTWPGIAIKGNNHTIANNIIKDNGGFYDDYHTDEGEWCYSGIHPFGCKNSRIYHNLITGSRYAIYMVGSSKNDIYENNIINNKVGIILNEESRFNKIARNNFIRTILCARFSRLSCFNEWDGNYWNRPRLLPKPIIGSIGFIVPWINFDWHPAKEPYDI